MRLNQILAVSLLGLSLFSFQPESLATEVHFIEVFVPLLVPQEGLVVRKVIFQTEYSTPESEIMATCWPYVVNSVPNEKAPRYCRSENLNVASLSNFKIISSPSGAKDERKIVVLDVSKMTDFFNNLQERMTPCTKMEILETTVKALEQNLQTMKIQNCLVSYAGKELHPEADWSKLPKMLNVVSYQAGVKKESRGFQKTIERYQHDSTGTKRIKENTLVFEEDLDGDGKKDKVLILPHDSEYDIFINDKKVFSDRIIDPGVDETGIVDIDEKDKFKEIYVFSMGPSDDPTDHYYHYNGKDCIFIGEICSSSSISGDGFIYTEDWWGSWRRHDKYFIDDEYHLKPMPQPFYWVGIFVKVGKPFPLFSSSNKKSQVIETVVLGDELLIVLEKGDWLLVKTRKIFWGGLLTKI
jgi:hypothetical protein